MFETRNSLMYQAVSDIWEVEIAEEETNESSDETSESSSDDET